MEQQDDVMVKKGIRMPKSLYEDVQIYGNTQRTSANTIMVSAVESYMAIPEVEAEVAKAKGEEPEEDGRTMMLAEAVREFARAIVGNIPPEESEQRFTRAYRLMTIAGIDPTEMRERLLFYEEDEEFDEEEE